MSTTSQIICDFIRVASVHTQHFPQTLSDAMINKFGKDPFRTLCSCLISLRARDSVTTPLCLEFFSRISTPEQLRNMPTQEIEKVFYSVGFYKTKARVLQQVAQQLCDQFNGRVPSTIDELLQLHGVGRKTANLVISMAFDQPAICVDIHVHRLANALGWVRTKTPDETEFALQKLVPQELWSQINRQFVLAGQNGCMMQKKSGHECPLMVFVNKITPQQ